MRVAWTQRLAGQCLAVLLALATAFAGIGFVEYAHREILLNPKVIASNQIETYFRVNSLFFDPNIYGRFLMTVMLGLAALLLWCRRGLVVAGAVAGLVLLWAGLVLTLSQSSFTALLAGLAVLGALRWGAGRAAAVVAVFALAGAVVVLAAPSAVGVDGSADTVTSGRATLVSGGIELARDRPVAGWGAGSFRREYRRQEKSSSARASAASHTIPITVAAEQGVGGLVLYLALVGVALVGLLRGARASIARAAIAAAFVALVVHTLLYAAFLEDPLAWVLLAAGAALARAAPPAAGGGGGGGGGRGAGARGRVSAREGWALAGLIVAALAGWALVPTYPDYDAYHHLVWGRDLLHGDAPGFETFAAPTQHPLYLALAALLSLAGQDADRLLVLVTLLSLAALVAGSYALGRALFGAAPALLGALFVGSSFAFLLYAARAFVDVPFLALVVWAAALEAQRPHRGALPMALLATAGLLRPEAWVLAGLYWLWCCRGRWLRERLGLLALVVLAPLTWALVDLAVTGDALHSLRSTSELAELLGRERGVGRVPELFVTFLADVARPPVALAGVIGLVVAVRRFGVARMAVPVGLLGGRRADLRRHGHRRAVDHPALPHGAGGRAVRARGLRGARLREPRRGAGARALAGGRGRGARRGGRVLRAEGVELRSPARGAALHRHDARRADRAARLRARARRPALRRAHVPDVSPRPRRALDPRCRSAAGALARRGPAAGRRRGLHRRRREVRAPLRACRRGEPRDERAAARPRPSLRSGPFAVYVDAAC